MTLKHLSLTYISCVLLNVFSVPDKNVFYVTLAEQESHVLENGEEEEQFLTAVEKGDVHIFMDLLAKKEEILLNIECKDSNGMSALRIAIAEGYAGRHEKNRYKGLPNLFCMKFLHRWFKKNNVCFLFVRLLFR